MNAKDLLLTKEKKTELFDSYMGQVVSLEKIGELLNKSTNTASLHTAKKVRDWAIEIDNPFTGYVDVAENIRMAKEQGFENLRRTLIHELYSAINELEKEIK